MSRKILIGLSVQPETNADRIINSALDEFESSYLELLVKKYLQTEYTNDRELEGVKVDFVRIV